MSIGDIPLDRFVLLFLLEGLLLLLLLFPQYLRLSGLLCTGWAGKAGWRSAGELGRV